MPGRRAGQDRSLASTAKCLPRASLVGAAIIIALLVALGFIPWSLPEALLRRTVLRQIEDVTGLKTMEIGSARFAILPGLAFRCETVALRDTGGATRIEAKAVRGHLAMLPLLFGRLEARSLTLDTPTIAIDLDGRPFERIAASARALPAGSVGPSRSLGKVTIDSGLLRLASRSRHIETLVADVHATLDWKQITRPATLSGSGVWRGRAAQVDLSLADLAGLLRGASSAITLRLRSDAANVNADGRLWASAPARFEGSVRADAPSLDALARLTALRLPLQRTGAAVSVDGQAQVSATSLAFSDATFGLNGNVFQGWLALRRAADERFALTATLATDQLSLDPLTFMLPSLRDAGDHWSRATVDWAAVTRNEIDIRVSAGRMRVASLLADDAALSMIVRRDRVELSLDEANAYRGTLKARAVAAKTPAGVDIRLGGSFEHLDVREAAEALGGRDAISGTGTGDFALSDQGIAPATLVENLDGALTFRLEDGAVDGIDIEQALRQIERKPLLSADELHSGATSFNAADVKVLVHHGVLSVAQGLVSGPGALMAFGGALDLRDGTMTLTAHAAQTSADGGRRVDGPALDIGIDGPWRDVRLAPDAVSLVRRQAGAPLLVLGRGALQTAIAAGFPGQ